MMFPMLALASLAAPACQIRPLSNHGDSFAPGRDRSASGGSGADRSELLDNLFFYIAQLVLSEEHLTADKECRRAEGAAVDRIGGVLDQLFLDVVLLGTGNQPVDVDAGRLEGAAEGLEIVHLLRLDPHVMIGGAEIGF